MRTYGHWDAVATALDAVGDRWSLLIVRELLVGDGLRYTDLLRGLPGIATNQLADRLRDLEASGVVNREDAPPPVATTLFRLTDRGQELRPVVLALARWGASALGEPPPDATAPLTWLAITLEATLRDRKPDRGAATLEVRTDDGALIVDVSDGIRVRRGTATDPDGVLRGTTPGILDVLSARVGLEEAKARGTTYLGDAKLLRRIRP